ncbi:MAG TPA: FAD-binding oxidoreductase, partial [Aliiroseovarius sp.]|nr:FAD-binding oxidoreductase [Aliiroseovarius sp.]
MTTPTGRGPTHETAIAILKQRFGDACQDGHAIRDQHAHTTTWLPGQPPDAVVFAKAEADVQDVVRICAQYRVPVIGFGAGSSLEGHVNAPLGGVSPDFRRLD